MNVRRELLRLQGDLRLEGWTTAGQRGGQERDFWSAFTHRERRRLSALGVVRADGECPDRFVQLLSETPGMPAWFHEDHAGTDAICERWCREILAAADHDGPVGRQAVEDAAPVATLPGWCTDWLEELTWSVKRDYARAYAEHVYLGHRAPETVEADWARKVERKVANRFAAALGRGEEVGWSDHDGEGF